MNDHILGIATRDINCGDLVDTNSFIVSFNVTGVTASTTISLRKRKLSIIQMVLGIPRYGNGLIKGS